MGKKKKEKGFRKKKWSCGLKRKVVLGLGVHFTCKSGVQGIRREKKVALKVRWSFVRG